MNRALCLALCAATLFTSQVAAQNRHSISLKTGISRLFLPKYTLALEWKIRNKHAFELSGSYQQHNHVANAFVANHTKEYALRKTYKHAWGSLVKYQDSGWSYLGDGRPIEDPKDPGELAFDTYRLNFGFRNAGVGLSERLKYFIQPSVTVALHRGIEIGALEKTILRETIDSWQNGASATGEYQGMHTIYYSQTQEKKTKGYWLAGPACQFGLYWNLWKGLSLEPRLNLGINVYKEQPRHETSINELRPFFGQIDLMVCYAFGF